MDGLLGYIVIICGLIIHLRPANSFVAFDSLGRTSCIVDGMRPTVYADTNTTCFDLCMAAEDVICDLFSWDYNASKACVFRKDGCTGNMAQINDGDWMNYRVIQPEADEILRIFIPVVVTISALIFTTLFATIFRRKVLPVLISNDLPVFLRGPTTGDALRTGVENAKFTGVYENATFTSLLPTEVTVDCWKSIMPGLPRIVKLVLTLGSTLFNVVFISNTFWIMPDRSPDVPLDLARKLVVSGEFSNIIMMIAKLITGVVSATKYDDIDAVFGVTSAIAAMNSFRTSAFSLIMMASPGAAFKQWARYKAVKQTQTQDPSIWFTYVEILVLVLTYTLKTVLGLTAVAAKLSQFSFLSSADILDWTPTQCFAFLGMVNQLAGLGDDPLRCVPLINLHTI
jgi:hypothetical protein